MEGAVSVYHKKEVVSQDLLTASRGGQGPGNQEGLGEDHPPSQVTSQQMESRTIRTSGSFARKSRVGTSVMDLLHSSSYLSVQTPGVSRVITL